jgi:hypothetical protein
MTYTRLLARGGRFLKILYFIIRKTYTGMKVENYNNKYLIITSEEGMMLTEWAEGTDIMQYSATAKQFSPLNFDTSKLREITEAEHNALLEKQELEARIRDGKQ